MTENYSFKNKKKKKKKKKKKEKTNVLIMLAVLRFIKRKENHSFFSKLCKIVLAQSIKT